MSATFFVVYRIAPSASARRRRCEYRGREL